MLKRSLVFVFTFLLFGHSLATDSLPEVHPTVEAMLMQSEPPEGVVFDVETLESNALTQLAPYIREQIMRLKSKFPDVDIAVVSHGLEEFSLQKKAQAENAELHNTFSSLVQNQNVSMHVCGAVAGLNNLTQEDFPEFVSYSESGMAQINDYKALGYTVVHIKQLTEEQRKDLFENKEKYLQ